MKLVELCEPVFLEICRMNRALRQPELRGTLDEQRVRAAFVNKLTRLEGEASGLPGMAEQVREVKPALVALMDDVVRRSTATFALTWLPLSQEFFNDAGWAQNFYERLDQLSRETPNPLNTERLMIYYICLGLGFLGMYGDRPELAKERAATLQATRLREPVDTDLTRLLLPELTKPDMIDTREWVKPSWDPLIPAVITLVVMGFFLIIGTVLAYHDGKSRLNAPLERINQSYANYQRSLAPAPSSGDKR